MIPKGVALLQGVPFLENMWPCWSRRGSVGVGVAVLEYRLPCWRKYATMGVDFEVSCIQAKPGDTVPSCCLQIKM